MQFLRHEQRRVTQEQQAGLRYVLRFFEPRTVEHKFILAARFFSLGDIDSVRYIYDDIEAHLIQTEWRLGSEAVAEHRKSLSASRKFLSACNVHQTPPVLVPQRNRSRPHGLRRGPRPLKKQPQPHKHQHQQQQQVR